MTRSPQLSLPLNRTRVRQLLLPLSEFALTWTGLASLCVQCGLCSATCPEKVIALEPRINFAAFEAGPIVVKEEEPFCCTKCGKAIYCGSCCIKSGNT